jgi:hypothetical protein
MTASTAKSAPCLGFLTIVESPDGSMVGGYLVLTAVGRPLEFHCTAPLRPTRTQQILYGPTLRPFFYGEQIAPALLARSQRTPLVICTDQMPVLGARPLPRWSSCLKKRMPPHTPLQGRFSRWRNAAW